MDLRFSAARNVSMMEVLNTMMRIRDKEIHKKERAGILRTSVVEDSEAQIFNMVVDTTEMQTFMVDNTPENWVNDEKGYFLIRLDREKKKIEAGFCEIPNLIRYCWIAGKARDIYLSILRKIDGLSPEHIAYLAKELYKAQIALERNLDYVQDDELDFKKNVKQ